MCFLCAQIDQLLKDAVQVTDEEEMEGVEDVLQQAAAQMSLASGLQDTDWRHMIPPQLKEGTTR